MRFLYAVNVVILIIFFCSFHNDTSVVSIPKTVNMKLETFLIHFDEGKGICTRSSKGSQLFLEKRRKKSAVKSREFIKMIFLVSCHAIKLKVNRLNRL